MRKFVPLFVLCAMVLAVAGGVVAQDASQSTALSFVAETYGLPRGDLKVAYKDTSTYLGIGQVTRYKIAAGDGDAMYGAVVDGSGQVWTVEDFTVAADEAYFQLYGKMDVGLFDRYDQDPSAVIPVAIWLKVDDSVFANLRGADFEGNQSTEAIAMLGDGPDVVPPAPDEVALEAERAALEAERQVVNTHVAGVQATVAARLADLGIETVAVPETPLLSAVLTRDQVLLAQQDAEVGWIFADDTQQQDLNDTATATHRAPAVFQRGYTGDGAKVAILEDSRAYANFWLYHYVEARVPGDPNMDAHATQTMGNVGSNHGQLIGMAPDASLYSANATTYSNANLQAAAIWAASTKGVDVINNSWGPTYPTGCIDTMGIFFDYRVVNNAVLVTDAAGNSGYLVGDHSMAYSTLAVGAFDDKDHPGWGNDLMASYSAYEEGSGCGIPNGDRNKPDVAATGSRIKSLTIPPPFYIDKTYSQGTSYAAPMVAGEAALIYDVDSTLRDKPESFRAIIMASARNNIEGYAYLSEKDGAGGIDAYSAYILTLNSFWSYNTVDPQTWTQTSRDFYADSGEVIRCTATWTSHPNSGYTTDPLLTDIDLKLIRPSGSTAAVSQSFNNSYETLQFVADESGIWTCRAYKWGSSTATWEYLGMAFFPNFQGPYNYPN